MAQDFTLADSAAKRRFALSCRAPWPCAGGPQQLARAARGLPRQIGLCARPARGGASALAAVSGARRRADECPHGRDYDVCPSGARSRHRAAIDQRGPRAGAVPGWRSGVGGVCVAPDVDLFTQKRRYAFLVRPAELRRPVAQGAATRSLSATWASERSRSAAAIVKRWPSRTRARGTGRRVQFHVAMQIGVFPRFEAGSNWREASR